ncbi:MAG TPA: hypothetical protein VGE97_09400 [Nitrososphaera sp.]|jgi:hypothetical protein
MPKTKDQKRAEAAHRGSLHASRTNEQQLAIIKNRRGNSAKEVARLSK